MRPRSADPPDAPQSDPAARAPPPRGEGATVTSVRLIVFGVALFAGRLLGARGRLRHFGRARGQDARWTSIGLPGSAPTRLPSVSTPRGS